jgi:hypothetical protein
VTQVLEAAAGEAASTTLEERLSRIEKHLGLDLQG